jgi:16S rRNA G966 N2-methylase RsmD
MLMAKSQKSLSLFGIAEAQGPVECLGMTFSNDEARRTHFLGKLREKLKDPAFRKIEGFPIGEDEDILAMSDPPYYTACPNPFLADFVRHHGKPLDPTEKYRREPLAVDSSEGKTDPVYSAHSYHTKVPHKAIMRAILHYTAPGDVVLDGFSGSGMTGVAAQMCGRPDSEFKQTVEEEARRQGREPPSWGVRKVVLNDLSPAATFIARGYNLPFDLDTFVKAGERLLSEVEEELGWMYETLHTDGRTKARINYTVWSENFACPECGREFVFHNEALDQESGKVQDVFPCPHCGKELTKDNLQRIMETLADPASGTPWRRVKFSPVLICYSLGRKKFEKQPDKSDLDLLARVSRLPLPRSVPTDAFPIEKMYHGSRLAPKGFTRVHHLFLARSAQCMGLLWSKVASVHDPSLRAMLLFFIEQAIWGSSLLNRYSPTHFSQVNRQLSGVYYVASQHAECGPRYMLDGKLDRLARAFASLYSRPGQAIISTGTATCLGLPDTSIDYIFTDPPFGENIFYADLNFLVEAWHRVKTDAAPEAVVDEPKDKGLPEYQHLMQRCFEEYRRVLKPGRWMTVVFHNSKNAVWNAIQEAMLAAGFVVADVRTLDKQQGSYRQVTSSAVKQDLIISAYRPSQELEERFRVTAGTEESAWEFARSHLRQLPVIVVKNDRVETMAERQNYLLYDRMVAFHVQRGFAVPLSSAEFHAGLRQRFPERDGMYFLSEQVIEYDRQRLEVKEVEQYQLFVSDEKSAIQWVRRLLAEKPMTYQDLQPVYMKEAQRVWEKHEQPLELRTILDQNFVQDGDGTWRVPDPKKEADLEQIRHRALMKEFQQYLDTKGRLKLVRTEALRAGFKECWQKADYPTIVQMARRVPDAVIQEDQALLMYYDNALMRVGE